MPHNHHHHHHHPGLAFGAGMAIGAGMAMGGTSSSRGGSDTVTVKNNGSTTVVTDVHRNRFGRVTEVDRVVTNNNPRYPPVNTVVYNAPPPQIPMNNVVYNTPPPRTQTNIVYGGNPNAGPIIYTPPPQQNKTVIVNGPIPSSQQIPMATAVQVQQPQQVQMQPQQVQMQPQQVQMQPQQVQMQQQQQWPVTPFMTEFSQIFFSAQPEQQTDNNGKTVYMLPPLKARDVLIRETQLPTDQLKQIWDLVEEDGSGSLDLEEFGVAMYLARNLKNHGTPLPATLPPNLKPPSHPINPSNPF